MFIFSIYCFDEDTKIYSEINTARAKGMLQKDLDSLQKWSDPCLIKFHPNKCEVVTVTKSKEKFLGLGT